MNEFDLAAQGQPHYQWPLVTPELEECVREQMHRSLSDRDANGVIGEFEAAFASFAEAPYAISFSSGTGALHALARTLMSPGQKIIAPSYTFFATATPFAYEGVQVVFADADPTGNVSVETIAAAYEPGVAAVIVTHMWGLPCDMAAIAHFCQERDLLLFEDCSHAHFGFVDEQRVGLHGDAAVFSTNQKAITSGEGGVLVTRREDVRDHALLFGHYNKRCKRELAPGNPERKLAFTGYGLKYRMHTLSAAVGLHQLSQADDIERRRRANLALFSEALAGSSVVSVLNCDQPGARHGLYVCGLKYHADAATVSRDDFVARFIQDGGYLLDIPGSTRDISAEPLFEPQTREQGVPMKGTNEFADAFMKLPLWGYAGDERLVEVYASSLRLAADAVQA